MRHRFHSICPYFAMFPESFAEEWIDRLTKPGDTILDPFSGRGTTALSAILMGRRSIACDVNDVAYCLTKAKTDAPTLMSVVKKLRNLELSFTQKRWMRAASELPEFFQCCFSPKTLSQLMYLRAKLDWKKNKTDAMIGALVLGALHGESDKSQSYLSNQMPRTISTKPTYSVNFWKKWDLHPPERDAFSLLIGRAKFRYESGQPKGESMVIHRDMRQLVRLADSLPSPIRCAITSPPYFDTTNFEEDQWLRLWFLGGPPLPTRNRLSRDDRHEVLDNYWSFITDMWRSLCCVISAKGHVVIRISGSKTTPDQVRNRLIGTSRNMPRKLELLSEKVSEIKKRQTNAFRPGTVGCGFEIDCHFQFKN
jgi:hypothetical protein